ncbi:TonB-dependent receptor domain-containing protein [Flavobacterium sp. N2270]|uniref:TonB-dependent receptor domain-containing protein n=1 Tax=Flavobacterium sp. N2270 TaxID=2986831 RepID=UPI002225AC85|nr:TonB-dependent receptor [Flavobacterium sp. N2270]
MSNIKNFIALSLLIFTSLSFAQQRPEVKKVTISGTILEKGTNIPLEYATVVLQNAKKPEILTGGITDIDGKFSFEVNAGEYNVRYEFISFKTVSVKNKKITSDTNLGTVFLEEDIAQLNDVVVVAERSTVEIKLDKRVYNVGKDMTVKGGTVSDVLDNVPSVTVDPDGTIALRGNENVRILIDGKPSGLAGINIADALKLLPADAVEKVEVITNPSARYDAEGSGGIINIVLRKGKAQGINGSVVLSVSDPESYGASTNLNYRSDNFNLFSNFGYNYRNSPGNSLTDSEYFNNDGTTSAFINERRTNERLNEGYNANFGIDLFLNKSTTWTNSLTFTEGRSKNPDDVYFYNYDNTFTPTFVRNRFNDERGNDFSFEYATNFTKNFKKEDHKLTVDIAISQNRDNESSIITDQIVGDNSSLFTETTLNNQKQQRNLFQADYVLPIGENGRFEAGYRGSFQKNLTVFEIEPNTAYSNTLEYNEDINALYAQYGNKINKFSYFLGMRFEDSNIDVNSLTANDYNNKKYNNFFPSATINYEISESNSLSLSYSKRINRPRGRFLNPFSSYSSNINIFQGNPDLDPSYTNAIDLGYLKRWSKLTLNSSVYVNITDQSFEFIKKESGLEVDGIPVILSTPINLSKEYRAGFEFNVNYSPYKWWKLNGNLNVFRVENDGDYSYTDYLGNNVVQNFDNVATTWFTRASSKITLPYEIDWQTNVTYRAPQTTAQGKRLDMTSVNLAFSKDILKDKGSISLNVSDLFNTRKRRFNSELDAVNSYTEFQWRQRQITLAFTYRFNKKKNERENQKREDAGGDAEFM